MDEPIIARDIIRAKARRAFNAGRSRDSHAMKPGAPALIDWLAEYDRMASAGRFEKSTPVAGRRVDVRQVEAV